MSAHILSGTAARDALIPALIERVKRLSYIPTLAIIQVGDRPDSTSYIRSKKLFAKKVGVAEKHIQASEGISQAELTKIIQECNADALIQGIIVQLPLPSHLNRDETIDAIDPRKDVDALTSYRIGRWQKDQHALLPATARGVKELLAYYDISLAGKKVCVIGRSKLVGEPIAAMCRNGGATVAVCHSKTPDISAETLQADVVIAAVGKPGLIQARHVKPGQTIIDVGINTVKGEKLEEEIGGRKLVGDADFEGIKDIVVAITPVPGGVGPMTVLGLFENLIDLCENRG